MHTFLFQEVRDSLDPYARKCSDLQRRERYIGNHGRLARRPLVRRMERMDPQTTRKENIASSLLWRGCPIAGVGANYAAAVRATPSSPHVLAGAGGRRVPDTRRIAFYRQILAELTRTIADSARVRAYHAWSLVDNFEWSDGYTQRYGLTYIDFRNQKRTIKDSGLWYGRVAAANRLDV